MTSRFSPLDRLGLLPALVLALLATLLPADASAQDRTYLASVATDRYFGTITNRGGLIGAAVPDTARAEAFEMIRLDGNRLAFRSLRTGDYLRAGVGQGTHLMAASPHIRGWETFEMEGRAGGVALRSVQNGRYLTVAGGGDAGLVSATADRVGATELFRLETVAARAARPVAEGRGRLALSYAFDFDTGRQTYDGSADARFELGRDNRVRFTPVNGARMGPPSTVPLGADACRARGFTTGALELRPELRGDHVCILTNRGNIATVQLQDYSLFGDGLLAFGYVTRP